MVEAPLFARLRQARQDAMMFGARTTALGSALSRVSLPFPHGSDLSILRSESTLATCPKSRGPPLPWTLAWFVPLTLAHWIAYKMDFPRQSERLHPLVFAAVLGVLVPVALTFVRLEYRPFTYFQF